MALKKVMCLIVVTQQTFVKHLCNAWHRVGCKDESYKSLILKDFIIWQNRKKDRIKVKGGICSICRGDKEPGFDFSDMFNNGYWLFKQAFLRSQSMTSKDCPSLHKAGILRLSTCVHSLKDIPQLLPMGKTLEKQDD